MARPEPAIWPVGGELPPPQPTVEGERLYRKQRLAAACRIFGRMGFDLGGAGHITARDPKWTDRFWVNPYPMSFRHVRVSDLLLVDEEGRVVEGRGIYGFKPYWDQVLAEEPDFLD